ncbi:MAG: fluoride efflux transporter CrcB [Tannerellaceae bacterium]|jgi:CrcB protein|nr:fluoride efflux transporter CrcB [Tannerellaceae bacterium]
MKITAINILLVGAGGALGSILRYSISSFAGRFEPTSGFPFATLTVNIAGCLLIGLLAGVEGRHPWLGANMKLLLVSGFCGGYTTFSTLSFESLQLFSAQRFLALAIYIVGSILLGFTAVALGYYMVKH